MKVPKWLKILIVVLFIAVIALGAIFMPKTLRDAHARSFANKQAEYMQTELKKGTSVDKVKAITQARITEEHASKNTDFDYTKYSIVIDEENKYCYVNVTMAYGNEIKSFSTKKLEF